MSSQKESVIVATQGYAEAINTGKQVSQSMESLVGATSELPLSSFDQWERLIRTTFRHNLNTPSLHKWYFWSKPQYPWLDLISWDGHKREQGLRELSGKAAPNAFFFSLALRRLNYCHSSSTAGGSSQSLPQPV